MAQAITMMLNKSETYGMPLPEPLAQMKAAVEGAAPNPTKGKSVSDEKQPNNFGKSPQIKAS
jgi:hypothetical protein